MTTSPEGGSSDTDRRAHLVRLVRQRIELSAPPLILEGLTTHELHELLAGRAAEVSSSAAPTPAAEPATAAPPTPPAERSTATPQTPPAERASAASPADASSSESAAAASTPPNTGAMDYETLRDAALACTRCRLARTRTQGVFADGNPDARVMVVGEAPGANEDASGLPFVGAAGRLLDLMLASVDLSRRDSVYICNVIKCRPPGNRNPEADELATCAPWLHRQIELVRPEVILAVGTFAGQLLSGHGDRTLGALRGEIHSYRGVSLVVTYHPAALLRNGSWTQPTWDDLQLLRQVLDPD